MEGQNYRTGVNAFPSRARRYRTATFFRAVTERSGALNFPPTLNFPSEARP
jgi:hypothetical protein